VILRALATVHCLDKLYQVSFNDTIFKPDISLERNTPLAKTLNSLRTEKRVQTAAEILNGPKASKDDVRASLEEEVLRLNIKGAESLLMIITSPVTRQRRRREQP
jgi:hypothetical protein